MIYMKRGDIGILQLLVIIAVLGAAITCAVMLTGNTAADVAENIVGAEHGYITKPLN